MALRDKPNNPSSTDYNADPITNSASFKYKTITGKKLNANQEDSENTEQENIKTNKNLESVVPLKNLTLLDLGFREV